MKKEGERPHLRMRKVEKRAIIDSTSGYRADIGAPQFRHFPPSRK